MKLSEREKILVLVVPAALVFGVYLWFFYPAERAAFTRVVAAVEAAHDKEPELRTKVLVAQTKVSRATAALSSLQGAIQKARKVWDEAAAHCTEPAQRNERIGRLNALLGRRGLRVIEDSEADTGKDGKVATTVDKLCTELSNMSAKQKPQLRKVRLVGKYLDVLAALEDLASREVVAIPVGLMMKEAETSYTMREWVLLVWI